MNSKIYFILCFLSIVFLLINSSLAQDFNPKSLSYLKARIILSGKLIAIEEAKDLKLRLYLPQEKILDLSGYPNSWNITYDNFGNKMIEFFWDEVEGEVSYFVEVLVEVDHKKFDKKAWEFTQTSKFPTNLTYPNEEMKLIGFGNEPLVEKVSRLTRWVHEYITYDESISSELRDAKTVFKNKRGICADYSILLVALLRAQQIPSRFALGFASSSESNFTMHSWIEVFDGEKWIPFDPTWLEGYYLDASHIKLANLLDHNLAESISYSGFSKVEWIKNKPKIEILEYRTSSPFSFELPSKIKVSGDSVYLLNLTVKGMGIERVSINSCIDETGNEVIKITPKSRTHFVNNTSNFLFLLSIPRLQPNTLKLVCPLTIYDDYGNSKRIDVEVIGNSNLKEVTLKGPIIAIIGKKFNVKAETEGTLFSLNSTEAFYGRNLNLTLNFLGKHAFYFYSSPSKYGKYYVNVVPKKYFEISSVKHPETVELGRLFNFSVKIDNLVSSNKRTNVLIFFENVTFEKSLTFLPKESKTLNFSINFTSPGKKEIIVQVDDFYPNSYIFEVYVEVPRFEVGIFDKISFLIELLTEKIERLFKSLLSILF